MNNGQLTSIEKKIFYCYHYIDIKIIFILLYNLYFKIDISILV